MTAEAQAIELDPENTLYLDVAGGRVVIMMYPDKAPRHITRIKELVREKFYDGLTFHRVIPGFMAQGGDPDGDGSGGSGQMLEAEFNDLPHLRGTASMARSDEEDSADSQFFICFNRAAHLDNKYTAWGRVVAGMEYVDAIERGMAIDKMRVAADVDG